MTTTTQSVQNVKTRIANFEPFVNGVGFIGMTVSSPRKKSTAKVDNFGYFLRKIDADFGMGFHMKKAGTVKDGEESEYDVNLDLARGIHTCDCKGNQKHGHCKHVEALLALIAAGKIEAPTPEPQPQPQPDADACPSCGGNINKCGCFDVM